MKIIKQINSKIRPGILFGLGADKELYYTNILWRGTMAWYPIELSGLTFNLSEMVLIVKAFEPLLNLM